MTIHSNLLYGTAWKEEDTARCVKDALAAGFRAIDTANQRKHYFEEGVGDAIQAAFENGTVTRDDLFLQTKFTFLRGQDARLPYAPKADVATQVRQSFESSLSHLRVERINSLVLHGPSQGVGLGDADWQAWGAMEEIAKSGHVDSIGISNVRFDQLQELHRLANVKPMYVQNRCFAVNGWDREIREFCQQSEIRYQGFSLLTANRQVFGNPTFTNLIQKYQTTPAQLVFRFAKQIGMWPLTGTTNPNHMREDLDAFEEEISSEDLTTLETEFVGA